MLASSSALVRKNISFSAPPKTARNSCRDLLLNILGFYLETASASLFFYFLDKLPTFSVCLAGAGGEDGETSLQQQRWHSFAKYSETLRGFLKATILHAKCQLIIRVDVVGRKSQEMRSTVYSCSFHFPVGIHQNISITREHLSKLSTLPRLVLMGKKAIQKLVFATEKTVKLTFKTSSRCIVSNRRHLRLIL